MAGVAKGQIHENFRRIAEGFKKCLRAMGYKDARVDFPLDVLENDELKITFVIDEQAGNIRMKAKGVWTNVYGRYPPAGKEIPQPEGMERLFEDTGEVVACEQCGCIDFVKKGEEYACAICCQSNR